MNYEDDYTNFAHTEVVAWGRRNCWQLAGADPARVTVLCERLHDCVGSSQVDDMAEAATAVPSTETPTILGTERVAAVAVSPARYKKSFTTCQNLLRRGESYEICLTDTIRLPDWDRLPGAALVLGVGGAVQDVEVAGEVWTIAGAPHLVKEATAALQGAALQRD